MTDKEKMIIGLPAPTVIKTVLVAPDISEEIVKLPPERGGPIFIDLTKKHETPNRK